MCLAIWFSTTSDSLRLTLSYLFSRSWLWCEHGRENPPQIPPKSSVHAANPIQAFFIPNDMLVHSVAFALLLLSHFPLGCRCGRVGALNAWPALFILLRAWPARVSLLCIPPQALPRVRPSQIFHVLLSVSLAHLVRLWPGLMLVSISHIGIIYAYQFAFIHDHASTRLKNLLGSSALWYTR